MASQGKKDTSAREATEEIVNGNNEFVEDHGPGYFAPHSDSQAPFITMVTCSDSRVQSRVVLPDAVNSIFTIRNIGNQISSCEGSVDYGILHLNTPVLLIMGHADCGAIKAFLGGYGEEPVPIKKELDGLQDAFSGSGERENVPRAVQANVDHQVAFAVEKYGDLVKDGKLTVVGAFYDFRNDAGKGHGRIVFINVNGETGKDALRELPILKGISEELRKILTGRL